MAEAAKQPVEVGDIRRDYFIALSPHQEWLWIFCDVQGGSARPVFLTDTHCQDMRLYHERIT